MLMNGHYRAETRGGAAGERPGGEGVFEGGVGRRGRPSGHTGSGGGWGE